MSEKSRRIAELIFKHIEGELDDIERTELNAWLDASEGNSLKFRQLTTSGQLALLVEQQREFETDKKAAWLKMLERGLPEREPVQMRAWKRYVAVAAAVILIVACTWIWSRPKENPVADTRKLSQPVNTIAPGHDGAVVTLADGKKIVLDSAANGMLAVQGIAKLEKQGNGRLVYNTQHNAAGASTLYNEVSTARGRKWQLTLPDGSNVWLNASSSIRFPTSFTGTERNVSITGEVYFEVAKNAAMPFVVIANNKTRVQVYGTHFNVMAYRDESSITTTLLEGSVRVSNENESALLVPGQQAVTSITAGPEQLPVKVIKNADTELAMAWRNGFTSFKHADLKSIMRQVERWYDISVVYEGAIPPRTFSADVPRDADLSVLLKILKANEIHFRIEAGRKLVLTP